VGKGVGALEELAPGFRGFSVLCVLWDICILESKKNPKKIPQPVQFIKHSPKKNFENNLTESPHWSITKVWRAPKKSQKFPPL
jgi:hypothetical protein